MARVIYSPRADADLFEIAATIAQDKPLVASAWVKRIRDTCDLLAGYPQIWRISSWLRCLRLSKFQCGEVRHLLSCD